MFSACVCVVMCVCRHGDVWRKSLYIFNVFVGVLLMYRSKVDSIFFSY